MIQKSSESYTKVKKLGFIDTSVKFFTDDPKVGLCSDTSPIYYGICVGVFNE